MCDSIDSMLPIGRLTATQAEIVRVVVISLVILIPCFWHPRIEAGDLASHTYNAWIANLAEQGKAPGVYIDWRWTNTLADLAVEYLGRFVGFVSAEHIVVGISVLIFFWGAFALITVVNQSAPWFLTPLIAMLTYAWTFYAGFLNFYISLGLTFFVLALIWQASVKRFVLASLLAILVFFAHAMGFACLIAIAIYIRLWGALKGRKLWVFFMGLLTLAMLHFAAHRFGDIGWRPRNLFFMNGFDQLDLGSRYNKLAYVVTLLCALCVLQAVVNGWKIRDSKGAQVSLEIWIMLLFAAAVLPDVWVFPQYSMPFSYALARLTSLTAIFAVCFIGGVPRKAWHLVAFGFCAAAFFFWTYHDTSKLNDMEFQVEGLVRTLPYGRRVMATFGAPSELRFDFIEHMVDRACIERCFSYSNYEPSSGQFRVRAHNSPVVTDSLDDSMDMQGGVYTVREQDLPANEIYQCDNGNPWKVCMRPLSTGVQNGSPTE